jgi:hypothetical protein
LGIRKLLVLVIVAALYPVDGHGMERAAMDQLLALSRSRSDSPEFREALAKHLGDAPIKSGEAYNSNGRTSYGPLKLQNSPRSSSTISLSARCGGLPEAICGSISASFEWEHHIAFIT